MANAWFYRNESKLARERAAGCSDPIAGLTWLRIAEEYDKLADNVDAMVAAAFRRPPIGTHPQPMQQQQAKKPH
jgi:hypothetical protein